MDLLITFARRTLVAIALLAAMQAGASAQSLTEHKVKSAYLFNFVKFVKWPPSAFQGAADPFIICTLGQNALDGTLEQIVQGKTVDVRPIVVRHVSSLTEAKGCHVLFVSGSELAKNASLLTTPNLHGILTVSEVDDPGDRLRKSAAITFVPDGNRIRFTISPKVAEKAGVEISSKLLSVAMGVD